IAALTRAVAADPFLAVAYFMRGVCLYNANALNDSVADFNDALTSSEAYKDFDDALRSRPSASDSGEDFRNIDEAIKLGERAHEYLGPYAVPPDCLYRPPTGRVKNSEKKDYLGKSKVVASVEATDNYAGFSGRELKLKTLPRSNSTNDIPTFPGGRPVRSNTTTAVPVRSATVTTPSTLNQRIVGGGVAPSQAPNIRPAVRSRASSLSIQAEFRSNQGRAPAMSVNPIDELMSELDVRDSGGDGGYPPSNGYGAYGRRPDLLRANTASPAGSVSTVGTVADKVCTNTVKQFVHANVYLMVSIHPFR
ncbi:unnamed protein product, partial [Sphagnum tenellum]